MVRKIRATLIRHKYETLLIGLLQHIFSSMFYSDLEQYSRTVWPITMLVLGISSIGLFDGKGRVENMLQRILFGMVILLPLIPNFFTNPTHFMQTVSLVYALYFGFLFFEVMRYLLRPERVNSSVLFASVCGFLLILEIFVFVLQFMYYNNPSCMLNINTSSYATVFIDFVYFGFMVLTSIGFGDIVPHSHNAKLFVSLMGIFAQIYNVVLVGILISRFSNVIARTN